MKYTAVVDGDRILIEALKLNPPVIEVEIAGKRYAVQCRAVEPGVFWFNWQNRSIEVSVAPNGEGYSVSVGGKRFSVEVEDERTALRKISQLTHAGEVELRAPMPGKVVRLLAEQGAQVHANQGVLVMEAMKMQNEIKSPKDGKVKRLGVASGAAVNAGDILAVIE
jgi:biotin carboxyl carrier protein